MKLRGNATHNLLDAKDNLNPCHVVRHVLLCDGEFVGWAFAHGGLSEMPDIPYSLPSAHSGHIHFREQFECFFFIVWGTQLWQTTL